MIPRVAACRSPEIRVVIKAAEVETRNYILVAARGTGCALKCIAPNNAGSTAKLDAFAHHRVGDESVVVNLNAAHSALASAFGSMPGSVFID